MCRSSGLLKRWSEAPNTARSSIRCISKTSRSPAAVRQATRQRGNTSSASIVRHSIEPRRARSGGGSRELADGIYGELFERSLFRYFHGRSSLATWLRAVLAQRHVDRVRAGRRLEPLADDGPAKAGPYAALDEPDDCRELIGNALTHAISELRSRDRLRLACYYAQELTLAETGKLLGEHEASCSRHLARTRRTLRGEIERQLREQHALSEAEMADCFASVSQDPGELDLRQLLRIEDRKESQDDRSTVRGRT